MYVCMHACLYLWVYVSVCVYVGECVFVCVCVLMCPCMRMCMCNNVNVCMAVCMYIHIPYDHADIMRQRCENIIRYITLKPEGLVLILNPPLVGTMATIASTMNTCPLSQHYCALLKGLGPARSGLEPVVFC